MILTFEIFGRARNHYKKFLKLCQTSFSGIVNCDSNLKGIDTPVCRGSHYEFKYHFEIQVAKATNGQTNGSAEESKILVKLCPDLKSQLCISH